MTLGDLQQLFYLDKLIERQKEMLEDLHEKLGLHSPTISDMPKSPGAKDKIGDIVPEIADQAVELDKQIQLMEKKRKELTEYIMKVPNIRIRLILIYRYLDQLPWMEVADKIGGKETEYSVKHTVYRYIERTNKTA